MDTCLCVNGQRRGDESHLEIGDEKRPKNLGAKRREFEDVMNLGHNDFICKKKIVFEFANRRWNGRQDLELRN